LIAADLGHDNSSRIANNPPTLHTDCTYTY